MSECANSGLTQELLGFEYRITEKPFARPLLLLTFTGEFPYGSAGHAHSIYMQMKTNEAMAILVNRFHRLPKAMIYDLKDLHYEWGDWMIAALLPYPVLQVIVAAGETRDALLTLWDFCGRSMPIAETTQQAIGYIEKEMPKTFIVKCPTCMTRFRGRRFTPYACPKCKSKIVVTEEGHAVIREKPSERQALQIIESIRRLYKPAQEGTNETLRKP
jgi:DNA-directed RNA polymerase subunit RPC12/RpoP